MYLVRSGMVGGEHFAFAGWESEGDGGEGRGYQFWEHRSEEVENNFCRLS